MHSSKSYQVFEDNIDAKPEKEDEKDEIDIAFYREIFFWFQFAYSLDQDTE